MTKRLDFRNLNLWGRSEELATLECAYNRINRGNCNGSEIVMVRGYSGTGKSSLVRKLVELNTDGCYFASGKFDQDRASEPYHALATALNQLCDMLAASSEKGKVRQQFLDEVGSRGYILVDAIPKLSELVGKVERNEKARRGSTDTSLNQLKYVFRALVRAVCNVARHPIILFLDDLQWADASSLELLESVALDSQSKRILVIGAYRDNEIDENHQLRVQLDKIEKEKQFHNIHLSNLDKETINEVISSVTELKPSDTQSLTEIVYQKTNGNIFFVIQFLRMLQEERLIFFSLTTYKWTWECDKIKAQTNLSDNVVDLVAGEIKRLQPQAQTALELAACLWSTFDVELLQEVMLRGSKKAKGNKRAFEYLLITEDSLDELLDNAAEVGLLEKLGTRYKFAHDRIRQAAYSLIPEGQARDHLHLWIGEILLEMKDLSRYDAWALFAAADQLNRGAVLITEEEKCVEVSRLNLIAAEKAISMSAFFPALSYLRSGISLLHEERRWKDHYDLCLRLHVALADTEYCTGNLDRVQKVADTVIRHARCCEDKINASHVLALSLLAQSRHSEANELCYRLLSALGEPLPKRCTRFTVSTERAKLKRLIDSTTPEEMLKLPEMTNQVKINVSKFQGVLLNSNMHRGNMRMVKVVAMRLIRLTLLHGRCDDSAVALVFWAYDLVCKGELAEGYLYGQLALKMAELMDSHKAKAHVVGYTVSFTLHWREPLHNTLDPYLNAHKLGMLNGDILWACQCASAYQLTYFYCGLPLGSGTNDSLAFAKQMKEYDQETCHRTHVPVTQTMLNLMGRSEDVLTLTGEVMCQDEFEDLQSNPDQLGVQIIASCRMQLAFYFDDLDLAERLSRKLQNTSKNAVCKASYLICVRTMFFGLISIALARKTKKRKYVREARAIISMMESNWVKRGAINCLHKLLLLKAEFVSLKPTDLEELRKAYDAAISVARRCGFVNDEALANERAGKVFLDQGERFWASLYLSRACVLYAEWEAFAKVDDLEKKYGSFLTKDLKENHTASLKGQTRFTDHAKKTLDSTQLFGAATAASDEQEKRIMSSTLSFFTPK